MNRRVTVNRLTKLIEILRVVPKKKFYMGVWGRTDMLIEEWKGAYPANFIEHPCTSAACALGWAASYKPWAKKGLHLEIDQGDLGRISYQGSINFAAGMKFFGIQWDEAEELFDPDGYPKNHITPSMVVRRIKRIIGKYEKELVERKLKRS